MIEKSFAYERKSLGNLDVNYAAHILHQACISPASIMIAMLYLERIKNTNPDYLRQNSPSELFLVSLVSFFYIVFKLINFLHSYIIGYSFEIFV